MRLSFPYFSELLVYSNLVYRVKRELTTIFSCSVYMTFNITAHIIVFDITQTNQHMASLQEQASH